MFNKILIANRGEIALRIIRTCQEMGIQTVAVYSIADKDALHVRFADEAVCIGPSTSRHSYLNISHLLAAAELTNAQAIHPGYGFLAENADFARACQKYGIKFIGPSPETIARMSNKAMAKAMMQKAGVRIIPGSEGLLRSPQEGINLAKKVGYPILLKAAMGGGGKGIRTVHTPQEFMSAWDIAQREAQAAFNNDGLYLEKLLEDSRHIEIQIISDQKGNFSHLSERDCSIQRKNQKLIEEAPSAFVTPNLREQMGKVAIEAARFIGYEGVGTIEFLVDKYHRFYFLEMNTRIQAEHPVTEVVMGIDLVREQIRIAAGESLRNEQYVSIGHAIECRVNAEDPFNDFKPSPGKIKHLHLPGGVGVRVDTHIHTDYTVSAEYDSMIAKLIVHAPTREEAMARMKRVLKECVIEGVKTTIPLCLHLLKDERFKTGDFTTNFLDNVDLS